MLNRVPRYLLFTLLLATLAGQGGCAWLHGLGMRDPPPQVLQPGAGLEQVIAAVNRNNSQIQSLYSDSAMVSSPHVPTLHAHLAYQRPQFFRLKVDAFLGPGSEVDLGSNAEWFWFWVKRSEPPAIYYCRHEQFATSQARAMIPIEPSWLIEALGTMEIDPNGHHDGPVVDPNNRNRIYIRTFINTPDGPNKKITFIDPVSAWVMEQQILDAGDRLRARSVAEGYRREPKTGLYIPTAVRVECPAVDNFSMRIDLGDVQVNQPLSNPGTLFSMPLIQGCRPIDLGNPNQFYGPPAMAARR
jgi:hypothetical protein